tara:strand:- start:817 stop:936 length:120 start_codon:yes stop_codon:yes gene_type:complete
MIEENKKINKGPCTGEGCKKKIKINKNYPNSALLCFDCF